MIPNLTKLVWEGKKGEREKERKGEKRMRDLRERISTLSLDFPVIGPTNPDEARGKDDPHCKSYAWVLGLWSFEKLQEVGVLLLLGLVLV